MATQVQDIKSRYPLPAYNYRVSIFLEVAGQAFAPIAGVAPMGLISCAEVSGLKMEYNTVTYRHGFSFITGMHIMPAQHKEVNLSIRKGVTKQGKYLSDWMKLSYPLILPKPSSLLRQRNLVIDLCDEEGLPVVRWTVLKAMPVKLEAPSFKADSNEVAFEQMDLIAHELKVEYDF